jgi:hypothetical protein
VVIFQGPHPSNKLHRSYNTPPMTLEVLLDFIEWRFDKHFVWNDSDSQPPANVLEHMQKFILISKQNLSGACIAAVCGSHIKLRAVQTKNAIKHFAIVWSRFAW